MVEVYKRKLCDMEDFNENIILGKPWALELLETSQKITRKAVLTWCSTIIKIGESDLDVDDYVDIFLQQASNLYEDLLNNVYAIQQKTQDEISKLLGRLQNLCRNLHVETPTFNFKETPLIAQKKLVHLRIQKYESLLEVRRAELKKLEKKQLALCASLGRKPLLLSEAPLLPSISEMNDLELQIEALETEVIEREEKFFEIKEQIRDIVSELRYTPSSSFEDEILNLPSDEVRITDKDMEQLEQFRIRLIRTHKNVGYEIRKLQAKIINLWDLLETNILEREAFEEINKGNSLETLKQLQEEIRKLENYKNANIPALITKQRKKLEELWKKCHRSENETNSLDFFHSECFTEDLFAIHDQELSKWKKYYDNNKEIFDLLQKHQQLQNELKTLSLSSGGANRFKNRGCSLLTEEKTRNKLNKEIPKIERNLVKMAVSYFTQNGQHFLTFGQTIEQYIGKANEDRGKKYKLKKDAKKEERKSEALTHKKLPTSAATSSTSLAPIARSRVLKRKASVQLTNLSKKLKFIANTKSSKSGMPTVKVSRLPLLTKLRKQ